MVDSRATGLMQEGFFEWVELSGEKFQRVSRSPYRRGIVDHQLHVVSGLARYRAEGGRRCAWGAAALQQGRAQIGVESAEGDRFEARSAACPLEDARTWSSPTTLASNHAGVGRAKRGSELPAAEGA